MTNKSSSELVIRRLYQITQSHHQGFEQQLSELLKMGLERFELDIGILSNIEGDNYLVEHCVTPDDVSLKSGDCFDFGESYCNITCKAKGPISIEHMGKDDKYASHPAYKAFGLESYIGIPLRLNGQLYGTLNFSSPKPYTRHFKEVDIDALQLMASWIEVELIRREQEQQLKALNEELRQLADFDSLTEIPNRRGMRKTLQKDINRLSRVKGQGTLALIDIDNFKQLNDAYGHQTGDQALAEVAKVINSGLRDYDLVARFGGEEFLLWLPDTQESGCQKVSRRIMNDIGQIKLTNNPITVSIGSCSFDFKAMLHHSSRSLNIDKIIDDAISIADNALYDAKAQGRNRLITTEHQF
ncbi:sensor domain-containing diguanylate cyclase [Shewanella sp. WXL01]|uniref:sensor domain-containing diguanylate cyclase n=1 Tax=Shewanella sp. WXL01 TaxID=2709721 RepID=UPI0014383D77|nr:diguanylate cyclase [Shewanella sp. WXL01]NKF50022.1 sensor domain-containing diguanylate cyclase [Shewanella sp. WXL01]